MQVRSIFLRHSKSASPPSRTLSQSLCKEVIMYKFIKMRYDRGEMTALEVWEKADAGKITEAQATSICGPRPEA